ncbi:hypothetical protein M514_00211 [Trichuris suis]|uniref:Uncharacterized protein n=1 Tax=Trichuris suis TaxID=68888 RepID=A0A085NUE2_9BILA|nr:hypothetical protein M513_00211 [Trichuris suis]KFD73088.1 hypothetical protein M514_00211 [Trichuris suis]
MTPSDAVSSSEQEYRKGAATDLMFSSRTILTKLLLFSFICNICLANLNTTAGPGRCPHDIFSDIKGWREGERCVAIWEEKLTSTYVVLNELCSQRAPEATLPNIPPQSDVFQSHGVMLNPEFSVFLGASLTARYCASDRCSVVIEYSNKSGDSILYDEKNLTIYHSTRPQLQLPKNIQNIRLNYSGTDHFCLTMSNETTNAVSCLKSAITIDALICETDQLRNCMLTKNKRSYKSNCVCEKYYKGPHCGVMNKISSKSQRRNLGLTIQWLPIALPFR